MPYKLNWLSFDTMWCQFSGHVDIANVNQASNEFYNDHRTDHITKVLWDFSTMTHFDADADDASEIAFTDNVASSYLKPMKAAFITTDADFSELVQHYIDEMELLGNCWTNRLFSSLEDAGQWLSEV